MQRKTKETDEIGRKHDQNETSEPTGSERARDEQRSDGGPRYGGEAWKVADQRGGNRFGKARNDDAEPSEVVRAGEDPEAEVEEGHDENLEAEAKFAEGTGQVERSSAAEVVESSGEIAGMGRGDKPRKAKPRSRK